MVMRSRGKLTLMTAALFGAALLAVPLYTGVLGEDVPEPPQEAYFMLDPQLAGILETEGGVAAVAYYEEVLRSEPDRAYGCHAEAHVLGQSVALTEGVGQAITLAPALCQSGFLHGVLQVAAKQGENTADLCSKLDADYIDSCAHGFGHLLAVVYPNSISDALRTCTTFLTKDYPEGEKLVGRCGGGAAMEYGYALAREAGVFTATQEHATMGPAGPVRVNLSTEDLARPCAVLQEFSKKAPGVQHECLIHLGFFFMRSPASKPAEMHQSCKNAVRDAEELGYCLRSAGLRLVERYIQNAGGAENMATVEAVKAVCGQMPENDQEPCAVGGYQSVYTSGLDFLSIDCSTSWQTAACREARSIITAEQRQ